MTWWAVILVSHSKGSECHSVVCIEFCRGSQLGEDIREGLLEMSTTFPMAPNTILLRLILGDVSVIFPSKEDK